MRRYLVAFVVMAMLLPLFCHIAGGDGIPMTTTREHVVRENLQLAYVDVGKEGENMHLFLNVVSLDPGKNLTILIPLRTHPANMRIKKMNSSEFLDEYRFSDVERTWKRQNEAGKHIAETMDRGAPYFLASGVFGISGSGMLYLVNSVGNMGMGAADVEHYYSDGISVDVCSFNSSDSLMELYDSMGISAPPQSEEIIRNYGNYSVAVVNTVTKPPIPEEEWDFLEQNVPEEMDEFREYVKEHPYLEVYDNFYGFPDPQLNEISERILEKEIDRGWDVAEDAREYFTHLVLSTYGLGNMRGFEMSMDLPFYDGKAFFPLGTSPAWGGITTTRVMFSIDDNEHLSFNHDMKEAFYGGKHYYLWDMDNGTADYDLEADIVDSGDSIKYMSAKVQETAYDYATAIGVFLFLTVVAVPVGSILYIFDFKKKNRVLKLNEIPLFIVKTYLWAILFLMTGVFLGGAVLYRHIYDRKLIKTQKRRKWKYPKVMEYRISSIFAVLFILLLPFVMLVPMVHSMGYSLFMGAIYLIFMFLSYYLLYLSTKRPPFDGIMGKSERERFKKWAYLGMSFAGMAVISSILATSEYGHVSNTGACLFISGIFISYVVLLALQDRLGYLYGENPEDIPDKPL